MSETSPCTELTKSSPKTDEIITEKKVVELSIDRHKKKESKKD